MNEKKKPDHVVFDAETQSYNSKLLPYSSSVAAPKITSPDVTSWKNTNIVSANNQFKAKYEAIQNEYNRLMQEFEYNSLMQEFEYNSLVYSAKFNFEPIVGKTYHLYRSKDQSVFLSLIFPNEYTFEHLGTFKLGPDKTWEKL